MAISPKPLPGRIQAPGSGTAGMPRTSPPMLRAGAMHAVNTKSDVAPRRPSRPSVDSAQPVHLAVKVPSFRAYKPWPPPFRVPRLLSDEPAPEGLHAIPCDVPREHSQEILLMRRHPGTPGLPTLHTPRRSHEQSGELLLRKSPIPGMIRWFFLRPTRSRRVMPISI
jgi:hypothetical protein